MAASQYTVIHLVLLYVDRYGPDKSRSSVISWIGK